MKNIPALCHYLTEEFVKKSFSKFLKGDVEKFLLPGTYSVIFYYTMY